MARKVKKSKKAVRRRTDAGSGTDALFKSGTPSTGFSNLDPGTYDGYIKAGSAHIEPKDGGGHRAVIDLVCTTEGYEDRVQRARYDLTTQVGVDIFLGDLAAMEFDQAGSIAEAAEILAQTDDIPVRFWVGTPKDEFPPKVRINERLEEASPSSGGGAAKPEAANSEYTKKQIQAMSDDELCTLGDEVGLKEKDYDDWDTFAEAIIKELEL